MFAVDGPPRYVLWMFLTFAGTGPVIRFGNVSDVRGDGPPRYVLWMFLTFAGTSRRDTFRERF